MQNGGRFRTGNEAWLLSCPHPASILVSEGWLVTSTQTCEACAVWTRKWPTILELQPVGVAGVCLPGDSPRTRAAATGWIRRRSKWVFKRLDIFILKSHPLFWDIFMPVLDFQCAKCFLVRNENKKNKQTTKNSSWVLFFKKWNVKVLVAQSCGTLCDPVDCSPWGSSVHGILQERILEWVAIPFSRGSSSLRDRMRVSCIAGRFFTIGATREVLGQIKTGASTLIPFICHLFIYLYIYHLSLYHICLLIIYISTYSGIYLSLIYHIYHLSLYLSSLSAYYLYIHLFCYLSFTYHIYHLSLCLSIYQLSVISAYYLSIHLLSLCYLSYLLSSSYLSIVYLLVCF